MPYAVERGDGRLVRLLLIELASREANTGMREEPLRILGYVAGQPLDYSLSERLNSIRRSAGGKELARRETPWESKDQPRMPRPQQPEERKTVRT